MNFRKLLTFGSVFSILALCLILGATQVGAISLENSLEGTGSETITNISNLSIGTDTISGALYVVGNITATGDIVADNIGGTTTISAGNVSAGSFGANTGGGNYTFPANVTLGGVLNVNAGTGNVITLNNGSISGANIIGINDPGEGIDFSSGITMYVVDDANDDSLYINAPYVGIGTTSPATKLDVSAGGTTVGIHTDGYIEDVGGNVSTNYTPSHSWVAGGTGSVGIFGQNGATSENSREWGIGPHGNRTILWKSVGDTSSGPDGGWNSSYFSIDDEKTYRFTVWIQKTTTVDGTTYFGTHGQGCDVTSLGGSANSNPYFWASDLPSLNKWYLLVGYIHASNDTSTTSYGGIYDGVTGQKVISATDFKFQSCTTGTHHRSYLYYSTTGTATQYWWDPRVEEVNGSEPTIEALLGQSKGATAGNASYFGAGVSVNGTVTADSFSGALSGTVSAANVSSGSFGSGTGGGNYTFPANLTVDSGTLYVDSSNNRVGIGTTSPGTNLDINNSSGNTYSTLTITNPSGRHDTSSDDVIITGGIDEDYSVTYATRIGDLHAYSNPARLYGLSTNVTFNEGGNILVFNPNYFYGLKGQVTAGVALNVYSGDELIGTSGTVSGTINNGSAGHLVAAVYGNDASTGTATTWAGYFNGNVYSSGNVGIGTDSPGYDLDVSGNARVTGTAYSAGYGRLSHSGGHLVGSYNNVGSNDGKSNPIYTIGSSYNPTDTALSNMYGIGYSHDNFWYDILGVGQTDGWGMYVAADGDIRATISGTNGNIWSAGSVTAAGSISAAGSVSASSNMLSPYYRVVAGNGNGIRFWDSDSYKIHMGNAAENHYGPVTDYSIKMNMSNTAGRGWTWGVVGATPVGALNTSGNFQVAGSITANSFIGDGSGLTGVSSAAWTVSGSDIYNANSGNVGIGTSPSYKLHVSASLGSSGGRAGYFYASGSPSWPTVTYGLIAAAYQTSGSQAVGFYATADSSSSGNGRNWGIKGYAIDGGTRVGVEGRVDTGASYAAGIVGTVGSYDSASIPGTFAGYFNGNVKITGSISKGSGTFDIPYPEESMADEGYRLRHSFVESPTRGDNIYRYSVSVSDGRAVLELPEYFQFLNENPQVWVSPDGHFGRAYGDVTEDLTTLEIYADEDGEYNVLLIGTRKDEVAKEGFDEKGVIYQDDVYKKENK